MLTLDDTLHIPDHVSFTFVDEEAVLLNMRTNQYYLLDEVGARLWGLLRDGKSLRESYQIILEEFEVDSATLEQDVLELLENLKEHGLVEIIPA
jgi:Coenzyme PQQ synthesis protein D (PqqD)